MRLESTAVHVENEDGGVAVTYVTGGRSSRVRAKHCVLACYHSIIPHLCPEIPEEQKEAQRNQVKHPMLVTNVLLRSGKAFGQLGISGAYCPGRMHAEVYLTRGVNTAGYQQGPDEGPVPVMLWGMVAPPRRGVPIHDQLREAAPSSSFCCDEALHREGLSAPPRRSPFCLRFSLGLGYSPRSSRGR